MVGILAFKTSIIIFYTLLLNFLGILSDILFPVVYCMEGSQPEGLTIIKSELAQTHENLNILNFINAKRNYFINDTNIYMGNKIKYDNTYDFNDVGSKPAFIKPKYILLEEQFLKTKKLEKKVFISLKCEMLDTLILSRENATFCSKMYTQTNFYDKIDREVFSNSLLTKSGEIITKTVNIHFCIKSHPNLSEIQKDELLQMFRATFKSDILNQFLCMEHMFDKLELTERVINPSFSIELKYFLELNKEILIKLKKMSCLNWKKEIFTSEDLLYLDQILS